MVGEATAPPARPWWAKLRLRLLGRRGRGYRSACSALVGEATAPPATPRAPVRGPIRGGRDGRVEVRRRAGAGARGGRVVGSGRGARAGRERGVAADLSSRGARPRGRARARAA